MQPHHVITQHARWSSQLSTSLSDWRGSNGELTASLICCQISDQSSSSDGKRCRSVEYFLWYESDICDYCESSTLSLNSSCSPLWASDEERETNAEERRSRRFTSQKIWFCRLKGNRNRVIYGLMFWSSKLEHTEALAQGSGSVPSRSVHWSSEDPDKPST